MLKKKTQPFLVKILENVLVIILKLKQFIFLKYFHCTENFLVLCVDNTLQFRGKNWRF